ncbi:MAG TPA: right-handed parallel beta-helix repeat-containing protein [Planctomycetota bacterium]|nr:right-handed parallel beta-helix repeat-containing protein [Planctomycetota bacterium]
MNLLRSVAIAIASTLCASQAWAQVVIAERPQVGPFTTLQTAVDAALEGESLLAAPGNYASFIVDGKSVNLFVTGNGDALITGQVRVKNLATAQTVVLSRLKVKAAVAQQNQPPVLEIQNVTGHLRVQDSSFEGTSFPLFVYVGYAGTGARIESSLNVVFSSCTIKGGTASGNYFGEPSVDGGIGVDSVNSSVALYDCTVQGGNGSEESSPGGNGGHAYKALSYGLFASGCTFRGGNGGAGDYVVCNTSGVGGDGLRIDAGQAHLLANAATAGFPGGWSCGGPSGPPGQAIHPLNGAVIDQLPGLGRRIFMTRISADDVQVPITISGQTGDRVYLLLGRRPSYVFKKTLHGVWMVPTPMLSSGISAGTIGANGTLIVSRNFEILGTAIGARVQWLQAMCVDSAGQATLTGPAHLLSINAAGAPDCNGNARQDMLDVLFGGAPDCDTNLTPDSCDPDCNGNGAPDTCDIAAGLLPDCNGNGVPDACDLAAGTPDCNGNGLPDSCDIASHLSPDLNANGVPDECESQFLSWYVDDSASPGGNGSQAAPFRDLQSAVTAAFYGDTIVMEDGLYQGPGNRAIALNGRYVTLRSAHGPSNCTIDCQGVSRALSMNLGEWVTIEGISFVNGFSSSAGGAILGTGAHLTLRNCVFSLCTGKGGGAIRNTNGYLRVEGCQFQGNSAPDPFAGSGGALSVSHCELYVRDCVFANNYGFFGGAFSADQNSLSSYPSVFTHCQFFENQSNWGGAGALWASPGTAPKVIDNCQFAGNSSGNLGGALYCAAPANITSSSFISNSAVARGGAICLESGAAVAIRDSIAWGNSAPQGSQLCVGYAYPPSQLSVSYSDVQGGWGAIALPLGTLSWGAGNLDLDPMFVDPDGLDNNALTYGDNNYALAANSPCVDAGSNPALSPDLLDVDVDGNTAEAVPLDLRHAPRRVDVIAVPDTGFGTAPIVDMGPVERQG